MAAIKIKAGSKFNKNTLEFKALMYSIEYDDGPNDTLVMYGKAERIQRCLVGVPGASITATYDALEWRRDD